MRSKLRNAALLVAVAVFVGTAGVASWRGSRPKPVVFCAWGGRIPEPGQVIEVGGVRMLLIRFGDRHLAERKKGCGGDSEPLVTPDCKVHYPPGWHEPRVKKLDKATVANWCD